MNIIITSLNLENAQTISKKLAKKLHFKFINANEVFNKTLLKSVADPVLLVDDELNAKESELCFKLAKTDDVVVAMSDDMFLSNENYKFFQNSKKFLVFSKNLGKTKKNIEKIIQSRCNFAIQNEDNLDLLLEKLNSK